MSAGRYELIPVPLVEATIQVRFPGDARIDAVRGDFQQAIIDDFPHVYVPEGSAGESPTLMPYRFQNKDGTQTIALSVHSLAYLSKQYPGWETFRTEFMGYWSELMQRMTPRELGRIGLRYVNRFDSETAIHLNLDTGPDYLAPLRNPECTFHGSATNYENDEVGLLVNVQRSQHEDALVLDYDAYAHTATLENLEEVLSVLHDRLESEFLRSLDDEYKKALSSPKAGG